MAIRGSELDGEVVEAIRRKVLYFSLADDDFYDLVRAEAGDAFDVVTLVDGSDNERRRMIADVEAVIVGAKKLSAAMIDAAQNLKIVHHQGVGYHDTVDIGALRSRQITLAIAPGGTGIGVAEHTIMMMLATCRHLAALDGGMRQGQWHTNTFRSRSRLLSGMTIGIVGLGRIGKEVARLLAPFGGRLLYNDILEMPATVERELNVHRVDLDQILEESDLVTLHVPLTNLTYHLVDGKNIQRMKPGAILINCARGPVVAETALVAALEQGHLGGAGLDVFEQEPPVHPNPFVDFPNVVLTPHVAPGTRDITQRKMRDIFANFERFFAGEPIENRIDLG